MRRSLRRRFEQNQEDCTLTVLAILPTATENILDAIPVEQVLEELQRQKAERLARSVGPSEIASSAPPSVADTTEDDARSSNLQTESSFIHASQVVTEGDEGAGLTAATPDASEDKKSKKTKAQLWKEMKIGCMDPFDAPMCSTSQANMTQPSPGPLRFSTPSRCSPSSPASSSTCSAAAITSPRSSPSQPPSQPARAHESTSRTTTTTTLSRPTATTLKPIGGISA